MKRIALVIAILASFSTTIFAQNSLDKLHYEVIVTKNTAGKEPIIKKFDINAAVGTKSTFSVQKKVSYIASVSTTDGVKENTPSDVVTGLTGSVHPLSVDKSGVVKTGVEFKILDLVSMKNITSGSDTIQAPVTNGFNSKLVVLIKPDSVPVIVARNEDGFEVSVALKN